MKKTSRIVTSVIIGTVLTGLYLYTSLPPLNVHSTAFWTALLFIVLFYGIPLSIALGASKIKEQKEQKAEKGTPAGKKPLSMKGTPMKVTIIAAVVPLAVIILGGFFSSTFLNAHRYAGVVEIQEGEFSKDMPETDTVTNISLMDSDSARILGDRALGSLSDVVSQYQLSYDYNQINYKGQPRKVSNLEYVDFFRWINNSSNGIPGYVIVDPVNSKAEYVKLNQPLKYVHSAYFNQDLMRKLRFSYPTKIFGDINFELDEEGNPWFIVSCLKPHVGLFGAMDVNEVILFNPCDGSSELYGVKEAPTWIDNVFDGDLSSRKYDWYGTLSGGWLNSVIGNKDCKRTTDDFGYIVLEDDVWYFTGVTSVTADQSNIGFLLSNARTGEYKYYPVVGAAEYSAMSAAEGEVQEKGYRASFPSLINVSGQATYIMVLKDQGGLVKLYALVNVENYSIVATGDTQTSAKKAYMELLARNGLIDADSQPEEDQKNVNVTIEDVRLANVNGETLVYISASDGCVYKSMLVLDESLMLIRKGDQLTIHYDETENEKIRTIVSWKVQEASSGTDNTTPALPNP